MAVQQIVHLATEGLQSIHRCLCVLLHFFALEKRTCRVLMIEPAMEGHQLTSQQQQRTIQLFQSCL